MTFAFIAESCSDLPVATVCRVMKASTSGFYEWRHAQHAPCARAVADAALTAKIVEVYRQSRGTYGSPRVHAELRLGEGILIGRKRVERLMRSAGLEGVYRRRRRGCTTRNPAAEPADDLVNRRFTVDAPDRLWVSDITEHPTGSGRVYLAVVIDAWSRRVVGWSIADHLRSELVVDALQMAIWRRRPDGTVVHSDHGTQYTSAPTSPPVPQGRRRDDGRQRAVLQRAWCAIIDELGYLPMPAEDANALFQVIAERYAVGSGPSSSPPTAASPAGSTSSPTPPSPRPCSTGSCTAASCSTSPATATACAPTEPAHASAPKEATLESHRESVGHSSNASLGIPSERRQFAGSG